MPNRAWLFGLLGAVASLPACSTEADVSAGATEEIGAAAGAVHTHTPVVTERARLVSSPQQPNAHFGWAVDISGDTAVLGAPVEAGTGAAYVFTLQGGVWKQQQRLAPADLAPGDEFGHAVAISAGRLAVGANCHQTCRGAVYVFERHGRSWRLESKLVAADRAPNDFFGYSLAMRGDVLAVGAPNRFPGAVYVFERARGAFGQVAELTGGGTQLDTFGNAVALSGNTVVVGAPILADFRGAAYVFARQRHGWMQQAELTGGDSQPGDTFGIAVAVSGNTVVVGAQGKDGERGAAYVFERQGSMWPEKAELLAKQRAPFDMFGSSVAVEGGTIAVGVLNRDDGTGAVDVFRRCGRAWPLQVQLVASDGAPGDGLGWSVAMDGGRVLAGAPFGDMIVGTGYVFGRGGGAWHD